MDGSSSCNLQIQQLASIPPLFPNSPDETGVCSSAGRTYDFAGPFMVNEDCLLFGKPTRFLQLNPDQQTKPTSIESGRRCGKAAGEPGKVAAGIALGEGDDDDEGKSVFRSLGISAGEDATVAVEEEDRDVEMGGKSSRLARCGGGGGGGAGGGAPAAAAQSWDRRLSFAVTTYRVNEWLGDWLLNYNIMTNNCHCFVAHFLNQNGYRGGGWDTVNLAALMFVRGRYTSLTGLLHTWLPWLLVTSLGAYFGRLLFLYVYMALCVPLLSWFLFYTWCCWRDLSF
ncbi:hypothetical protein VOLCADRAFT_106943 [Volvox carteri f. nagariensis]|uniref:Uncharacterized protein n=1 Tax=Volvox carteri f. nagariensis TaxID=3068 RepID=D8UAS0_VOLCA|nr:uncharacterized protein VOLCADRAFT_106943 [Volvox carteri f. nagariensis]EFJ43149.1 hypothetical protein VOLCADRAFT_106943 [Volvox carteri f. nagariensis]|eukprot:XP_002955724.1 hypothetical protein VOLCADRAFT_106943 [Volvox carteri f. nagariensis]